ncbi:MAG: YunC family protein [Methanoregulaceae archaeon]|nr:YunC family protein [Methanoregulaceae archaeon]
MLQERIQLKNSEAAGYVVPLGPVNLVWGVARQGMVGCGAFDVRALEKFGYPAARVRPVSSPSVVTLKDLFSGEISEANSGAAAMGIQVGMSGKEALDRLS